MKNVVQNSHNLVMNLTDSCQMLKILLKWLGVIDYLRLEGKLLNLARLNQPTAPGYV